MLISKPDLVSTLISKLYLVFIDFKTKFVIKSDFEIRFIDSDFEPRLVIIRTLHFTHIIVRLLKYSATISPILGKYFPNTGQMFPQYWANASPILGKCFPNTGQMFPQCWANVSPILAKYSLNTGQTFPQYWANVSPILDKCFPNTGQLFPQYWANIVSRLKCRCDPCAIFTTINRPRGSLSASWAPR